MRLFALLGVALKGWPARASHEFARVSYCWLRDAIAANRWRPRQRDFVSQAYEADTRASRALPRWTSRRQLPSKYNRPAYGLAGPFTPSVVFGSPRSVGS